MKIGILTFHRATNYGAVLQCYGLYETLKSMGHDVEVIDYRPEYIEKYRRAIPFFDIKQQKNVIKRIKLFVAFVLGFNTRLEAGNRFDNFLKEHFKFTNVVTRSNKMPQYFDLIIFGSDQIWSPQICYGFDAIYWGQFPHKKTRLITYAASIGGHNRLSDDEWIKVGNYLSTFEKISVREEQLHKDLQNRLHIENEIVVDPTILVNEEAFERIAERPKAMPDNYVLVFSVAPTENLMGFAERVASQTKSQIVILSANKTPWIFRKGKKKRINVHPTVGEFLGWFKYAKCVVTVSFHGTVFSVVFRKDFYSLANYMQDRAELFLKSIGLEDRLQPSDSTTIKNLVFSPVDYDGIAPKLFAARNHSISFLKTLF